MQIVTMRIPLVKASEVYWRTTENKKPHEDQRTQQTSQRGSWKQGQVTKEALTKNGKYRRVIFAYFGINPIPM